jgi:hypothetical protein
MNPHCTIENMKNKEVYKLIRSINLLYEILLLFIGSWRTSHNVNSRVRSIDGQIFLSHIPSLFDGKL